MADQVFEFFDAEFGQNFTHFLRDKLKVIHRHLRQADEVLFTQRLVLRGHTCGAVVQMADAQVFAAQCDHRRGAEAETLGAEHGGFDYVQPGFQSTVCLDTHLAAQVISG